MSRTIMLIPTGTSVGLTSVSLGVIRAMERKGVRLSVFKPIAQPRSGGDTPDQTTTISVKTRRFLLLNRCRWHALNLCWALTSRTC